MSDTRVLTPQELAELLQKFTNNELSQEEIQQLLVAVATQSVEVDKQLLVILKAQEQPEV